MNINISEYKVDKNTKIDSKHEEIKEGLIEKVDSKEADI
jgi:hypothetical protein